jgi:hypothetical protein
MPLNSAPPKEKPPASMASLGHRHRVPDFLGMEGEAGYPGLRPVGQRLTEEAGSTPGYSSFLTGPFLEFRARYQDHAE